MFKGRIIVTGERLPMRFPSKSAFVAALRNGRTDRIWLARKSPYRQGVWTVEYVAFLAEPLNADQVRVAFHEDSAQPRYVTNDFQNVAEKGNRIFASTIELAQPEFQSFRRYRMTIDTGGSVLASTTFWLVDKLDGFELSVGPFGAERGVAAVGTDAVKLVRDTLAGDLAKLPGVVPAAAVDFHVYGNVTRLEETVDRGAPAVACEVMVTFALRPANQIVAWTSAGAMVSFQGRSLEAGRRDCLDATAHQLGHDLARLFASFTSGL